MEDVVMDSFWDKRPVLVTGATGFIGSHLVKALIQRGATVYAIVRDHRLDSEILRDGVVNKIITVWGDVRDIDVVERAVCKGGVDTIFHLAAQSIVGIGVRAPLQTLETNIMGTCNILEVARKHNIPRTVIASSDKAYGDLNVPCYKEDMALLGRFPYDVSKSCADLVSQAYFHTYDLCVVIARCGNVFGGGDLNFSRLIPGTIRSVLLGERPIIRSNGYLVRDYLYIDDAIEGYLRLAEEALREDIRGEAFNFSPETGKTVLEVVDMIGKILGGEAIKPIILDQAKTEIKEQRLSAEKARKYLGWQAKWSFEDALSETVRWYRQYFGK